METTTEQKDKSIAIIAYLTLIGLIIAIVLYQSKKEDDLGRYHILQALGLGLTGIALGAINIIPILGWIVSLLGMFVLLFMWISGFLNAIKGKKKPLPILGTKYEEWLAGLFQ